MLVSHNNMIPSVVEACKKTYFYDPNCKDGGVLRVLRMVG